MLVLVKGMRYFGGPPKNSPPKKKTSDVNVNISKNNTLSF